MSTRLTVLHIGMETVATRPGGLNRYTSCLSDGLRELGIGSDLLAMGARIGGDSCGALPVCGAVTPLPVRVGKFAGRAFRHRTWNVLDAHFALYAAGPMLVARARRRSIVVHFHGPWAQEGIASGDSRRVAAAKASLERAVYRRADRCVVLSEAFGSILNRSYGVPKWAIERIPPGVDLVGFCPGSKVDARKRLEIGEDVWTVVTARRLTQRMGVDVLLKSWSLMRGALGNRKALLVIVGDGPEQPYLEKLARKLGTEDTVRFLGRVGDETLRTCYQAADISVIPSVALEGFGLVALESLACGTPVIATDAGGLGEVIGPMNEALVVPHNDVANLERVLAAIYEGRQELPSGKECRTYAERFDWSAASRKHVELYSSISESKMRSSRPRIKSGAARLRVVVVGHTAQMSGGELAMSRLLPHLEGVDSHVLLGEDGPLVKKLIDQGLSVEVLRMDERSRKLSRYGVERAGPAVIAAGRMSLHVVRLAHRLAQLRPDIVHTNTLKAALYGGMAAKVVGIPCIWHVRDRIASDYMPRKGVVMVNRTGRALPSYVIANSRTTLETLDLPAGRGEVLTDPVEENGSARRYRRGDDLRIGMVGRITPWKGQDLFLRAFARAFEGTKERAVIVGSPLFGEFEFETELRRLVVDLGIAERVEFRGFQSDVVAELKRMDVLVHASKIPEPFGQVVLEGMAAGLPVIAADAGGPAEIISDHTDGVLYRRGDERCLAEALSEVVGCAEFREDIGRSAQVTAGQYGPTKCARRLVAIYEEVAGTRHSGR